VAQIPVSGTVRHVRRLFLVMVSVLSVALLGCSSGSEGSLPSPSVTGPAGPVGEEPDDEPCTVDAAGAFIECPPEDAVAEESVTGAIERVQQEETWDSDLRYLLLDEASYRSLLEPELGPAEFVPGAAMPVYGFYVPALTAFGEPLSWQQEWALESGATLVEQIVLFDSATDATNAFDAWKASASASGLVALTFPVSAPGSFDTAYSDPSNAYSGRTCATQSIVAVSRFLVSVSYLTGGDCRVAPAPVAAAVLAGVTDRIRVVFPG
jgi:hypothetical protein